MVTTGTISISQPIISEGTSYIIATGEVIGVELFPTTVIEKTENKGFVAAKQKTALTGLKVLVGNSKMNTGSIVFVRGDSQFEPWGKDVQELDGVKMLLCPTSKVLFCKTAYWSPLTNAKPEAACATSDK
jgi:hypothetical protein